MLKRITNKFCLIYRTISFLKFSQLFYQIKYRLVKKQPLSYYLPKSTRGSGLLPVSFRHQLEQKIEFVGENNTFNLLNLTVVFKNEIDWNYLSNGKLWNYNLQYFNFLNQNDVSDELKEKLLIDIGAWLKDGRLAIEPYPVSLRVINTIRFIAQKRGRPNQVIVEDVFAQLKYLNHHLEYHILGNHLLENAFALIIGGYIFKEQQWTDRAKKILFAQLDEQILNDGGHFELSPMYHQIILFRVLELIEWYSDSENNDLVFLSFLKNKAFLMLGWLKRMTFANGDIPHFSDSAKGISNSSDDLFLYARQLGLGNVIEADLNDSGYRKFVLPSYECIIDVGAVGPTYQPGHSHADALSFILHTNNKPFIVDTGTSTYQIGSRRSYERSTAAHNTVVINDVDQSEVWGGFRVGKRATVNLLNESTEQLVAEHDGYLDNFKVMHRRSFNFLDQEIQILDRIGAMNGKLHLHFHPSCILKITDHNSISIDEFGTIYFENATRLLLDEYEFADGFNQYLKGGKLMVDFKEFLKTSIYFNN